MQSGDGRGGGPAIGVPAARGGHAAVQLARSSLGVAGLLVLGGAARVGDPRGARCRLPPLLMALPPLFLALLLLFLAPLLLFLALPPLFSGPLSPFRGRRLILWGACCSVGG